MLDLTQCSAAQSEAIIHGEGPMLVLAGPGSGKTFVITRRIQYLIEYHKVKPEQILVITFTKAAATEMQERFLKLTQNQFYPVTFATFHAFFYQILRQTYQFNTSSILRESDKRHILEELVHQIPEELSNEPCMLKTAIEDEEHSNEEILQKLISEISKVKNLRLNPSEYESSICSNKVFEYLYIQYCNFTSRKNKIDFDDMVILCLQLLKERVDILELWHSRFQYILIDEFQDISPAQYEIIRLLAAPSNHLFIVGDDDQSIYRFRGSDPSIMLGFTQCYPDARQVLLNINYRSRPEIIEPASNLISHNRNRFDKVITAADCNAGNFKMYSFESVQEQSQAIISLIRQYMEQSDSHYHDIALIYRTNTNAILISEKLLREKIPVHMQEKPKNIYQSPIAKDLIAYIRYALYEKDTAAFYRIMNRPSRYIRRETVPTSSFTMQDILDKNAGKEYVIHNVLSLYHQLHFLRKLDPYAAINYIRHGIGYEDYLIKQSMQDSNAYHAAIRTLDELQERASVFDTLNEWLEHAESYEEFIQQMQTEHDEDAVQIVTMHASKGLEWNTVILPDVNEGITPHKKAVSEAETEEERRMFYVAMTRAKQNLFIFYVKEKTGGKFLPSRFLTDLQNHATFH